MTSVAAIVVTFNRKRLVAKCLGALLEQTRPLDRIYLIDNGSTDGTHEHLAALGMLADARLAYVRLERNSGGAGGFHEGMRRAHADGHDWLWLMDDDGEPAADSLALLAAHFDDPSIVAVMPMIADTTGEADFAGTHRGYLKPRAAIDDADVARPLTAEEFAGRETVDIEYYSFVGPCFPRRVVDAVGLPRAEFFIHYDDVEYARRIAPLGRAVVVTAARILHKEIARESLFVEKRALGRSSMRMRYDKLWLRYFGYRNMAHLIFSGVIDAPRWGVIKRHGVLLLRTLLYDDHKWRRIRFWNAALIDGIRGRFDNDRPGRILGRR